MAICQADFLRNAKIAPYLVTADSVLAVHDQPQSCERFIQADRRIFKYRASLQGQLCFGMITITLPETGNGKIGDLFRIAIRVTNIAIGLSELDYKLLAILEIGKEDDGF